MASPSDQRLVAELSSGGAGLRIAYLINSVEGGGAALPVPAIVEALASHGARVTVFALTRRDGRALKAFEQAGLPVVIRDGKESDHWAALRWVGHMLDEQRPDVLWTSLSRATLIGQRAARSRGVPVVSWQHAAHLKPGNAFLLRRQQHLSDLWIADSDHVAGFARRRLGVSSERLLAWPIFAADPAALPGRKWQPGDRLDIGSLGRLHPVKGYDVLIEAVALLRSNGFSAPFNWQVSIAGDGQERLRLSRTISELSLENVALAPYTPEPAAFLARLHAYVQPSRSEGFCIAAHEAMQAGLPVLASKVGEISHSVDHGCSGWLVRGGDVEDLADGLYALLSEPRRLHALGQNARRGVVERFSRDRFRNTAATILERLAGIVQARRLESDPTSLRSV